MDAVFKALADSSRRKLLDWLFIHNGQTLGQLCETLSMTRQAVTKHLCILEDANLIATIWRGREKLHYLNPVPLSEIYERWIGKYERGRLRALHELKKGLEGESGGWPTSSGGGGGDEVGVPSSLRRGWGTDRVV